MYLMYLKGRLAPLTESKLYSVNYSDKSDKSASFLVYRTQVIL